MWIARNKNNRLRLFYRKPILEEDGYWRSPVNGKVFKTEYNEYDLRGRDPLTKEQWSDCIELNDILYPEITFEISPKELIVK